MSKMEQIFERPFMAGFSLGGERLIPDIENASKQTFTHARFFSNAPTEACEFSCDDHYGIKVT